MAKLKDLLKTFLNISSKIGTTVGLSSSENILRSLYVIGSADLDAINKELEDIQTNLNELYGKINGSSPQQIESVADAKNSLASANALLSSALNDLSNNVNSVRQKVDGSTFPQASSIADASADLSTTSSVLASLISSAFSSLNAAASLLFKSYSADGKLSTLVQDLQDLANRSSALRSFLKNIRIPHLTYHRLLYLFGSPNANENVLNAYLLNFVAVTSCGTAGCDRFSNLYYCYPFKLNAPFTWAGLYAGVDSWVYVGDYIKKDNSGNLWITSKHQVVYALNNCSCSICQPKLLTASIDATYGKNSLYVSVNQGTKHATGTVNPGDSGVSVSAAYSCSCVDAYEYTTIVIDDSTVYLTGLDLLNNLI